MPRYPRLRPDDAGMPPRLPVMAGAAGQCFRLAGSRAEFPAEAYRPAPGQSRGAAMLTHALTGWIHRRQRVREWGIFRDDAHRRMNHLRPGESLADFAERAQTHARLELFDLSAVEMKKPQLRRIAAPVDER